MVDTADAVAAYIRWQYVVEIATSTVTVTSVGGGACVPLPCDFKQAVLSPGLLVTRLGSKCIVAAGTAAPEVIAIPSCFRNAFFSQASIAARIFSRVAHEINILANLLFNTQLSARSFSVHVAV